MHHVMNLPATIAVESISCANLTIKVPWRHFKSEPMSVVMEQVVVQMAELPTAGPPDKTLPGFDKIVQMLFVSFSLLCVLFCLSFILSHHTFVLTQERWWWSQVDCGERKDHSKDP